MNKKYILGFFFIALVIAVFMFFLYNYSKNDNSKVGEAQYNSTRTSQNLLEENENNAENTNNTSAENTLKENAINENNNNKNTTNENTTNDANNKEKKNDNAKKETEIASFTTKIYTKDSGRQNNLTLACSSLNDTTIENGKTFSFSKTVGRATSTKGYQKADVFRNGDVIEALGGGLCQVSTTLYNAVLKIPELKVTEIFDESSVPDDFTTETIPVITPIAIRIINITSPDLNLFFAIFRNLLRFYFSSFKGFLHKRMESIYISHKHIRCKPERKCTERKNVQNNPSKKT